MSPQTLQRFLRLDTAEKRVVLASAAALIMTRIGLRVCGFRYWQKFLTRFGTPIESTGRSAESLSAVKVIGRLQASTERHLFFRPSCLEHSLVLKWLLIRAGIPAKLIIGGRKQGVFFEAHAWVEVNDAPLDSGNAGGAEFVPFDAMDASIGTEIH